jgi:beta-glucosidase
MAAVDPPLYRDPEADVPTRVTDLLARMTREEKLAQLGSAWVFQLAPTGELDADQAEALLAHGIGQITRISGASSHPAPVAAELANRLQRHLAERTRLGIPAVVHEEVCSGLMAHQTTIFPQAIGVASTWRPEHNERLAAIVREQMRAVGAHQGLSPVLDICRDPRWGRTEETYGEDPHLVARFGIAFVRGLQGEDLTDGVVATAKHLVGYGASEGGLNWAPAHLPARELRDVYLHPFEAVVKEAGLRSVMNGYHELDGVPCGADRDLLTGILREEWGFAGCVVSDYFAVEQLASYHGLVPTKEDAAALALEAGIDVELPGTDCYGEPLAHLLDRGDLDPGAVDRAVRRVLTTKFELGLFEVAEVDVADVAARIDTEAHRAAALATARDSLVLLRNEGDLLPLTTDGGTIAVIGPSADDARNLLGDYTHPAHMETLLESRDQDDAPMGGAATVPDALVIDTGTTGIPTVLDELRARFGDRVEHARGCSVTGDDRSGLAEAAVLAARAEVVVLVVGDRSGLTDTCTSGEARDRSSLDLPGVQEELAAAVLATGTPVVTVLISGRPCGSVALHEGSGAALAAWLPGAHGARAIAEALDGTISPGGKLPISFPRSAGHLPTYYGHKRSGGRSHWKGDYVDAPVGPLYPFGHGRSYTRFTLHDHALTDTEVGIGDAVQVETTLTNTGRVTGDEVVQLYIRDPEASVTRPVLELKAFHRATLPPGGAVRLRFRVPTAMLGFHARDLTYVVEPGRVELFLGTSAADVVHLGEVRLVSADGAPVRIAKAFQPELTVTPLSG